MKIILLIIFINICFSLDIEIKRTLINQTLMINWYSWNELVTYWSAFLITKNWIGITAYHVVSKDLKYKAIDYEGNEYNIKLITWNIEKDLALIYIPKKIDKRLKLSYTKNINIWDEVYTLWNALWKWHFSLSKWIISWKWRKVSAYWWDEVFNFDGLIQTDAAVVPWFSGWPVIHNNKIIWINIAVSEEWQRLWFFIPTEHIIDWIKSLKK